MSDEQANRPAQNYPGNSHTQRKAAQAPQAKRNVERVTTGDAIQRKTPLSRKFADAFTGDDARSVGRFIMLDVLLPALKAMISDATSQGVDRILFGDSRPRSGRGGYTSYNRMYSGSSSPVSVSYSSSRQEPARTMSPRGRSNFDFGEILIPTRGEAEQVIDSLVQLISDYEVATVADLYQLVGITGSFTDAKWGWTDLRDARVMQVREGYLLDLPRAQALA
jgi:hypothetical protein